MNNVNALVNLARWGKGTLHHVLYLPDGKSFLAASDYGLALFDSNDLKAAPRWFYSDPLLYYETIEASEDSEDSRYIRFIRKNDSRVIDLQSGMEVAGKPDDIKWVSIDFGKKDFDGFEFLSPDSSLLFRSTENNKIDPASGEEFPEQFYSVREFYSKDGKQLLYSLKDTLPEVTYDERTSPESCDLKSFEPCGNAMQPWSFAPYLAQFSPDMKTITILYRIYDLVYNPNYSFVRIYQSKDGKYLNNFGSYARPVIDFSYSPDGTFLLLAYRDGTLELWNTVSHETVFSSRPFQTPVYDTSYSPDGRYLLLQHLDELDIRLKDSGDLYSKYDTNLSVLSPVDNVVAVAEKNGAIDLRDINTGRSVKQLEGHSKPIYALVFSDDGKNLASSSEDCSIRNWSLETGQMLNYFEQTRSNPYGFDEGGSRIFLYFLKFIPNNHILLGFGSWGTTVGWNTESGATKYVVNPGELDYYNGMKTLKPHFPDLIRFDPQYKSFTINDKTYDVQSGETIQSPPAGDNSGSDEASGGISSKDGGLIFTTCEHANSICVLDAQKRDTLLILPVFPKTESDDNPDDAYISDLDLSLDGSQLAVTTASGIVYIYQVQP
jgi:WD40 repeat protein